MTNATDKCGPRTEGRNVHLTPAASDCIHQPVVALQLRAIFRDNDMRDTSIR